MALAKRIAALGTRMEIYNLVPRGRDRSGQRGGSGALGKRDPWERGCAMQLRWLPDVFGRARTGFETARWRELQNLRESCAR